MSVVMRTRRGVGKSGSSSTPDQSKGMIRLPSASVVTATGNALPWQVVPGSVEVQIAA